MGFEQLTQQICVHVMLVRPPAPWTRLHQVGARLASVPGLPRYVRVLICGGGDNAVKLKRGRPGLTDHVTVDTGRPGAGARG